MWKKFILSSPYYSPLLLLAAGMLAYSNTFHVPFLFDDVPNIVQNTRIHRLWPLWELLVPGQGGLTTSGRPLISLSFALNYAWGGLAVEGYHAVNLGIHLLAGCVLYGLLRRTFLLPGCAESLKSRATPLALAIAALWLLHPLQTESVTYISQRAEMVMALCYLFSLYALIRTATAEESRLSRRWACWTLAGCWIGMTAKEVMVSAPLILFLYDRAFLAGSFQEAWWKRGRLYLGLAASWLLLGALVMLTGNRGGTAGFGTAGEAAWWHYALKQFDAVATYLKLVFWPHPLVFDYGADTVGSWMEIWPQGILIGLLAAATGFALWRWPRCGFSGAAFFAILAPSSSVIPIISQTMAEHRMYLPLAVPLALAGCGLFLLSGRAGLGLLAAWALLLAGLTWNRNLDYQSELSLQRDTVRKVPNNARARHRLGLAYVRCGRPDLAMEEYATLVRIHPENPFAHNNLGRLYLNAGQRIQAMNEFETALRLHPDFPEARANLGKALFESGNYSGAAQQFAAALSLPPPSIDPEVYFYYGLALFHLGDRSRAAEQFAKARELAPGNKALERQIEKLMTQEPMR